jgi:hypothetical protein
MTHLNWKYSEEALQQRGHLKCCIERLVSYVLNNTRKTFNRKGIITHGRKITIHRSQSSIEAEGKNKKRVKGEFRNDFIKEISKPKSLPVSKMAKEVKEKQVLRQKPSVLDELPSNNSQILDCKPHESPKLTTSTSLPKQDINPSPSPNAKRLTARKCIVVEGKSSSFLNKTEAIDKKLIARELSEFDKLQAKYNQLQLENSIILQREQDLLLDSCKQSDEKEEVEVSKVMKGIVKNQEKKSKRKSSTGTNKTQVKKKTNAKVTDKVKVAAKDTPQATATIEAQIVETDVPQVKPTDNPQIKTDWEIPAYLLKKNDERRLPLIDETRREEIVVVMNHRKERNKTGEFLICFGSGENFWASMTSVVKDIDKDTLKRYLTRNN